MYQPKPSFIDLSQAANQYSNDLVQIAQINQLQEEKAQKQVDDFEKYYDEKSLRVNDLPLFTNKFQEFKKQALNLARLNRAGGKPEELALANELKNRALKDLNEIYTNSTTAKQMLQERVDYRKNMFSKNFEPSQEVNGEIDELHTLPVDKLDFNKYKSPYTREIFANSNDYNVLDKSIKLNKPNVHDVEDASRSVKVKVDGVGEYDIPFLQQQVGYDTNYLLGKAAIASKATGGRLLNDANKEYQKLVQDLSIPETETDPELASTRKLALDKYNDIMSSTGATNLTPELLLLHNGQYLNKSTKDIGLDKNKIMLMKNDIANKLNGKRLEQAKKQFNLQLQKFGYTKEKDMTNLFFKTGAENVPSVKEAATKEGVDLKAISEARIKEAKDKRKKSSLGDAFKSGFNNPQ